MSRLLWIALSAAALVVPTAVGCSESVSDKDVQAARNKAVEAQNDVTQARINADQKVAEREKDARDAQLKLNETEMKAAATKSRDAFVAQIEAQLKDADVRIDQLEKSRDTQTEAGKVATDEKVQNIRTQRDQLKKTLDDLKSAEVLHWQDHQPAVQRAAADLQRSFG